MRVVFLDTVGLIALWDDRDQWHKQAEAIYRSLLAENVVMVTTEPVLLECGNAMSRLKQRHIVARFRHRLIEERKLLPVMPEHIHSAWSAYEAGSVGSAGIVDYISFQAMRRFRIGEALTNDHHFRTAGFVTLF
ncbi:MAG TPA: PIN domain-containing protein [Phycisphaerae bacterium]|nr:PIN domain-containing protein [Phycisphaerae bacterium]